MRSQLDFEDITLVTGGESQELGPSMGVHAGASEAWRLRPRCPWGWRRMERCRRQMMETDGEMQDMTGGRDQQGRDLAQRGNKREIS